MIKENPDRKSDAYRLFFEAVCNGDVENIVKVAYQLFESPVVLTDENYRLICQIPNKPIGNLIWDTLYKTKTLPKNVIWDYQNLFLNNEGKIYKPFYANWGIVKAAPRIFGEVYCNQQILGHAAIFLMEKPLRDDDIEITEIFINALKTEMLRGQMNSNKWQMSTSTCFLDLLNNNRPLQTKQQAVEILKKKITGNYAIIVTLIGGKASQKAFSTYAVGELSNLYRNLISVIYDDCLVTLIGEVDLKKNIQESKFIEGIINFLFEQNLTSGICEGFEDLWEIPSRYQQAFLTAKMAVTKHKFPLGVFSDYAPMQMFFDVSNKDAPEIFIHSVLEKINHYDKENHTNYYETLRIFSLSLHNKNAAAQKLFIHRNTLLYRLNRIQDIFDLPYEDEKTALHLLCSFLLLDANRIN